MEKSDKRCDIGNNPTGGECQGQAVAAVKTLTASRAFFAATIALTVYTVLSFIIGCLYSPPANSVYTEIFDVFRVFGKAISSSVLNAHITGAAITAAPPAAMAIGFWLVFISLRRKTGKSLGESGLSVIKAVCIVNLVCRCLAVLFVCAVTAIYLVSESFDIADELFFILGELPVAPLATVIIAFFAVLIVAVFTLLIIYRVKLIKTVNIIKGMAESGSVAKKISVFPAAMCIVIGVLQGISLPFIGILCLPGTALAVFYISLGVLLISYKNNTDSLLRIQNKA